MFVFVKSFWYDNTMDKLEYTKIPLYGKFGTGKFALVDGDYDGEYFSQFRYYLLPGGYAVRQDYENGSRNRKYIYLHQEVAKPPKGLWVDHIDRDKLNNRSCNLRWVTPKENAANRKQPIFSTRANKTGYRGVTITCDKRNKEKTFWYMASCANKYIGQFKTPKEAAVAYDNYVKKKYGQDAITNF